MKAEEDNRIYEAGEKEGGEITWQPSTDPYCKRKEVRQDMGGMNRLLLMTPIWAQITLKRSHIIPKWSEVTPKWSEMTSNLLPNDKK